MNINGMEIERKYLIAMPDEAVLQSADASEIVQTYLVNPEKGATERVRARTSGGMEVYTHTVKRKLSAMSREEDEHEISAAEYAELLKRADTGRKPVHKTRYCLDYMGQLFEIDVYPFWTDRAIMEIELDSEEREVMLPPFIEVIKEVTGDGRYTNAAIAREVPAE